MDTWAYRRGVKLDVSRPGKPTDNPFVESLNGRFCDGFLDIHSTGVSKNWFDTLEEVKAALETWRVEYNTERPRVRLRDTAYCAGDENAR